MYGKIEFTVKAQTHICRLLAKVITFNLELSRLKALYIFLNEFFFVSLAIVIIEILLNVGYFDEIEHQSNENKSFFICEMIFTISQKMGIFYNIYIYF